MVVLSEKYAVKFFKKILSSAYLPICFYGCSRICVQSMVQIIKKRFSLYAGFADELFGICYSYRYTAVSEGILI